MTSLPSNQLHYKLCVIGKTEDVALNSTVFVIYENTKQHLPPKRPLRVSTHLDTEVLTEISKMCPSNQLFIYLTGCLLSPYLSNVAAKMLCGTISKSLQQSRQMISADLPLSTDAFTPLQEAIRFIKHELSFPKVCRLSLVTILSSMCFNISSQRICSMILMCVEVRLTGHYIPESISVPFLKADMVFCHSLGTLTGCVYSSNMMESVLATLSDSFLSTLRCSSS